MTYEDVFGIIREETFDILDLPPDTPFDSSTRFDDHGAISIDVVTIVSCCMRRLKVRVARDDLMRANSIGELAEIFHQAVELH